MSSSQKALQSGGASVGKIARPALLEADKLRVVVRSFPVSRPSHSRSDK